MTPRSNVLHISGVSINMSDEPKVTKGTVMPLAVTPGGGLIATYKGEDGVHIRHYTPHKEGAPILNDVTYFSPMEGTPYLEAETHHISNGPAKVNSRAYCENYDRIFGKVTPAEA